MSVQTEPKFHPTTITDRVMVTLSLAQKANMIASIQGPPGIGKTTAVLRYVAENPRRVWYYAARRDTAAKGPFFRDLAVRFAQFKDVQTRENVTSLIKVARELGFGTEVVLMIIDEAQDLNSDTLETLRSIYDHGVLALAFVGNHTFADRHNTERMALTASPQFRSRVGLVLDLGTVESEDAATVARAYGIPEVLVPRVAMIAASEKGLRVVENLHRLATASAGGGPLTRAHWDAAITTLRL